MKIRIWLFILILPVLNSSAQDLTRADMKEDLVFLKKKLDNWYPGIGYYLPEKDFQALYDSLYINVPEKLSYLDFYRMVNPLISAQKDGHLNLSHRKKYTDKHTKVFPFLIRDVNGKYFTAFTTASDTTICQGTEILRIENQNIKEIHALLADKYRNGADGDIPTGRFFRTLVNFSGSYASWFGIKDSLNIQFILPGSQDTMSRYVACETFDTINARLKKKYAKDLRSTQNLQLTEIDSIKNAAILNIDTFSSFKKGNLLGNRFNKKLRRAFRTIEEKGYEHLVLDVRSNGGGAVANSSRLLSYILPEPFTVMRSSSLKPKAVFPYVTSPINPISPIHFFFHHRRDRATGLWKSAPEPKRYTQPARKYAYRKKLYFLVNGASYSATVSVLAHAESQGVGVRVGETPGGAYWGDFAARFRVVKLPNSRIRVRIPLKTLYHNVKPSDKFDLEPHYPVNRTYEDLVTSGRDFGVEYVKKLILAQGKLAEN